MSVKRTGIVVVILIVVGAGGYFGYRFVSKLMTWRHRVAKLLMQADLVIVH